jgi:hypothetical protein
MVVEESDLRKDILKGNFISGREFLLVAIVNLYSSNSRYSSLYHRKSHLITGRELDGKSDDVPIPNPFANDITRRIRTLQKSAVEIAVAERQKWAKFGQGRDEATILEPLPDRR